MSRFAPLHARHEALLAQGLGRQLRCLDMVDPVRARLSDGRLVTVCCSNDYLGLARHPELMAAFAGGGAGSSRLISGDRAAHHDLEEALSSHFGRPATLFSSGYMANLALLSTVLQAGDLALSDALNHASIIDGLRLSRAARRVVPHGQAPELAGARLVAVESLYSMDGDRQELSGLAGGPAWLFVDEAHAVGVLGPEGRGLAAAQGLEPDFITGTLGKAYGAMGAFVIGPPVLRELLISAGRSFIFSTGLPEGVARAALVGLRLADAERRERLQARVRHLRAALAQEGIPALGQDHIVPIVLGPRAMPVAAALLERGFLVPGIRPPTVPAGTERLRVTLSSEHGEETLDRLVEALVAGIAEGKAR